VAVLTAIFNTLIVIASLFLICLVLIQRGKGGGLAGAFGGVGGSSAFGTKAGDTFTKITVVTASVWILMAMILVVMMNRRPESAWGTEAPVSASKELGSTSKSTEPAGGETSTTAPSGPAEAPASPSGTVPAIPESAPSPTAPGSAPKTP
jgi:preprotein translocase subunit SecG